MPFHNRHTQSWAQCTSGSFGNCGTQVYEVVHEHSKQNHWPTSVILQIFGVFFSVFLVLPKWKRHRNAKKALSDHDSIHGHRHLNETERSVIARYWNFNAPKICNITVSFVWSFTIWYLVAAKTPETTGAVAQLHLEFSTFHQQHRCCWVLVCF